MIDAKQSNIEGSANIVVVKGAAVATQHEACTHTPTLVKLASTHPDSGAVLKLMTIISHTDALYAH
jgi:hypothetical protein